MKKVGVVRFLGTNCDRDIWQACETKGYQPEWLWHEDNFDINNYEAVIIPGGFSYGDYLRCGAMAAKSPVMKSVVEFAESGKPVLGICNGFQILCEVGLLPGALVRNTKGMFVDKWIELKTENPCEHWGASVKESKLPIAHGEGRFHIEPDQLEKIKKSGQIWLTYKENPNGSVEDIAGVLNENKNVAGLMPHPERAMFDWMGGNDGFSFF